MTDELSGKATGGKANSMLEEAKTLLEGLIDRTKALFLGTPGIGLDQAAGMAFGELFSLTGEDPQDPLLWNVAVYLPEAAIETGLEFISEGDSPFLGYGDQRPSWTGYLKAPITHLVADYLRFHDDERLGDMEAERVLGHIGLREADPGAFDTATHDATVERPAPGEVTGSSNLN